MYYDLKQYKNHIYYPLHFKQNSLQSQVHSKYS